MKRVIALAIVVVMALTLFASCGSSGIEGYWKGEFDGSEGVVELSSGGKGKIYMISGDEAYYISIEWKINGDKLAMTYMDETEEMDYELKGNKLTIDGDELTRGSKSDVPSGAVDLISALGE